MATEMRNLSAAFHIAFTHLSGTFPMVGNGVKRLKEKDLTWGHSENAGKYRYGKQSTSS